MTNNKANRDIFDDISSDKQIYQLTDTLSSQAVPINICSQKTASKLHHPDLTATTNLTSQTEQVNKDTYQARH